MGTWQESCFRWMSGNLSSSVVASTSGWGLTILNMHCSIQVNMQSLKTAWLLKNPKASVFFAVAMVNFSQLTGHYTDSSLFPASQTNSLHWRHRPPLPAKKQLLQFNFYTGTVQASSYTTLLNRNRNISLHEQDSHHMKEDPEFIPDLCDEFCCLMPKSPEHVMWLPGW